MFVVGAIVIVVANVLPSAIVVLSFRCCCLPIAVPRRRLFANFGALLLVFTY